MKKLILMFFIVTLSLAAQHKNKSNITKIVVRGVVLSYNKTDKIMSLYAKNSVFTTNDPNMKVKIEVYRNFSLDFNHFLLLNWHFNRKLVKIHQKLAKFNWILLEIRRI